MMPKTSKTLTERFWEKVARGASTECWPWSAAIQPNGYGQMNTGGGRKVYAHRMAYELAVRPIPDGLVIDHLCRNRACCNPAHLDAVTQRVNVERGEGWKTRGKWQDAGANVRRAQTHCKNGHEFTEVNTIRKASGGRDCRQCQNAYQRRLRASRHAP
jgi:hypothetical protein